MHVGDNVSKLLLLCILFLGGARPLALYTPHVWVVYMCYVPMVIALGVMNTAITTAASRLADKEQLGGFFGLLESVENVAGMIGPVLGGMLAGIEVLNATLVVVIGLYALAFALVGLFFEAHVTRAPVRTANKEEGSAPSTVAVGVKTKVA